MRGEFVIPVRVPRQGLITNQPPQDIPPTALQAGSNIFVDQDGTLRPRRGYLVISGYTSDTKAIRGLYDVLPQTGGFDHQMVIMTEGHVYLCTVEVDGATLIPKVTTQTALISTQQVASGNPGVFAAMWELEKPIIYFCGSNNFPIQRLDLNAATAAVATGAPATAVDMTMQGNRLVVCCPAGDFTKPFRVQWSARFNGQVWSPFAYNDLDLNPNDPIRAIRPIDRQSALIFRQRSIWMMTNNSPTNEFNAFTFTRLPIQEKVTGPVKTTAIAQSGTTFYYLGTDSQIYRLNGTQVEHISSPIDATIKANMNNQTIDRTQAMYMPRQRLVWFFIPTGQSNDPNSALIYDELAQCWYPFASFAADNFTATVTAADVVYANNFAFTTSSASPLTYVGASGGNFYNFFAPGQLTDNGASFSWSATWPTFSTPDPVGQIVLDGVELYFNPASAQTLTLTVNGLANPQSGIPNPLITANTVDVSNEATWNVPADVGTTNPAPLYPQSKANAKSNFINFVLSGTNIQGPIQFIGARIFCNQDKRPDFRAI